MALSDVPPVDHALGLAFAALDGLGPHQPHRHAQSQGVVERVEQLVVELFERADPSSEVQV